MTRVKNTAKRHLDKIFSPAPIGPNAKYNGSWLNAIIKDKEIKIRK
jgi:hypothetical protein